MNTTNVDLSADIIDVRDIIERVEELEDEMQGEIPDGTTWDETDQAKEMAVLVAILSDIKGCGGDEHWRGDWYPLTLIRDSHFVLYCQELLEDCGDIPKNLPHYIAIDWVDTALNIRIDYTSTDINGVDYWFR